LQKPGAWALAGLLALGFHSTPAAADYYGAIAFSKDDGANGYSIDYETRVTMRRVAPLRRGCRANAVTVVRWCCGSRMPAAPSQSVPTEATAPAGRRAAAKPRPSQCPTARRIRRAAASSAGHALLAIEWRSCL